MHFSSTASKHILDIVKRFRQFGLYGVMMLLLSCRATRYVPDNQYLLDKIEFSTSDNQVKAKDMRPYLRQKPNLKILGFVRFHLGIYNLSGKNEQKGVNRWLRKIGEAPVLYDDYATEKSKSELEKYLYNKGYSDAIINDTVIFNARRKRATITFDIETGLPFRLRNHAQKISDNEIAYILKADSAKSLMKKNMRYDLDILDAERTRIVQLLKTKGYYNFNKTNISFIVDTTGNTKYVDDTLVISNPKIFTSDGKTIIGKHNKYRIGDIYYITDFDPQEALKMQTNYLDLKDTLRYNGRYFLYNNKLDIKPDILLNNTLIEPFQYYNYQHVMRTHTLLMAIPIIQFDNIRFFEQPNTTENLLDCIIQLTPAKSQSMSFDVEGTNSNGNIGAALKLNYQHRNLFHGAEVFNAQTVVGSETQQSIDNNTNFNSQQLGFNTSLVYPKFIFPGFSSRLQKKLKASTTFSGSYNYQQRPDYTRYISQVGMRYNWKGESYWSKSLSLIDFNFVNIPYMSTKWWDRIKDNFERYSYETHVIFSTGFSLMYNDQKKGKFQNSRYLRLSAESAGNLLNQVNKLTHAIPDSSGTYSMFNVPISQYLKFDAEGVYNHYINETNTVAYRLAGGIAIPYGNRNVLPFEKRYFAGGANSLRAWRVRSLGPGTFSDSLNINQLGDLRLEANVEYRFKLISILEGALFLDAGNIWTIFDYESQPGGYFKLNSFYKELALGYGAGLRIDMSFFVFRFDVGIKFHDPQRPEPERWIFNPTIRETAFNFAIGYPF